MDLLEYHEKWFEYNFIDEVDYTTQLKVYETGDDKYSEHYRYRSFLKFIDKKHCFSDIEITRFIELVNLDHDQNMAASALCQLYKTDKLSATQYDKVKYGLLHHGEWAKRVIEQKENSK